MSTDYSSLLADTFSKAKAETQAAQVYGATEAKNQSTADDLVTQTMQHIKEQNQAVMDIANVELQKANDLKMQMQNDAQVRAYKVANAALTPDLQNAVQALQSQAQSYNENQGGFLNQFAKGLTGHDFALENLDAKGKSLQLVSNSLATLAQNSAMDMQVNKQLVDTQYANQEIIPQAKINQAEGFLTKGVKAGVEALSGSKEAAGGVVQSKEIQFNTAKELYMTVLTGNREQKENANADLQRKALQLEVDQRTMAVAELQRDQQFMQALSDQTKFPQALLEKQTPDDLRKIIDIRAGIPIVSNIGDMKEVETAGKVSSATNPDPYQKILSKPVADAILAYQQNVAKAQEGVIASAGKQTLPQIAKSMNFNIIGDLNKDFLDQVPMRIPGQKDPLPLTQTLGNMFRDPTGSGSAFWISPQVSNFATGSTPGAPIAQRVISDMKVNPGILKNGIDMNYLSAIGADKNSAFDFYNFLRSNVISSTPYQVFGLAPPQAKFSMPISYQSSGFLGTVQLNTDQVILNTPEDYDRALIKMKAAQQALTVQTELQGLEAKTIQQSGVNSQRGIP